MFQQCLSEAPEHAPYYRKIKFLTHCRIMTQSGSSGRTGTKILLEAMSKDKVHLARFVLDALDGEIVDSKSEDAQTPLISSILLPDGHTRCQFVELLLQKGANVNRQDGHGRTALSYACEKGYLDVVKMLVRYGADPEIVDQWGNTALMYAAVAGHSPVVEFLVRAFKRLGLQMDRQNKVGNSAVEMAKFLGHTECIFALTNASRKGRERGNAPPQRGLTRAEANERKVGHLANKLGLLQTSDHAVCPMAQNGHWQLRPRIIQSRIPSMGSIEELDRENDGSSEVLIPKPPPRTSDHSPNYKDPKARLSTSDDCLPSLAQSRHAQNVIFSPRPSRRATSPLFTPFLANKSKNDAATEKLKRRFHDSYYKKRCSLPTSILSPTPPGRTLMIPPRKSRTARRRDASPCNDTTLHAAAAAAATTTLSVLSDKFLRRSPKLKRDAKDRDRASGRTPRSETFPRCVKHPQAGSSERSSGSVSSVKCEFDFHSRKQHS